MTPSAEKTAPQEQITLSLPVKVEAFTPENKVWREVSRVESVSPTSANFYLTRPVDVGQLLLIKMPIKKDLRRFDFEKELYRVWAIVRDCRQTPRNSLSVYQVSAAFIGKEPPAGSSSVQPR